MFSRFSCVVAWVSTSHPAVAENTSCMHVALCIYLLKSWSHLYFHFLAILNNAAINMCVQVSEWTYVLNSLGYIPRSRIARSDHSSMFINLRNCQIIFQSRCDILKSHQQWMRVPIPHLFQCLLLSAFLILAILVCVKCHLIEISICIILSNDVESWWTFTFIPLSMYLSS